MGVATGIIKKFKHIENHRYGTLSQLHVKKGLTINYLMPVGKIINLEFRLRCS